MKRLIVSISFVLGIFVIACEDADFPATEDDITVDDVSVKKDISVVPAGERALELGVSEWEITPEQIARGYDVKGHVVAEFHVNAEVSKIESILPDRGMKTIGASNAGDTLTERSERYLTALMSDVEAAIHLPENDMPEGDVVNKAVFGCYTLWNDCDLQGFWLLMNGYIIGYVCHLPTSTCGSSRWALII
jgi:hypothetical protein